MYITIYEIDCQSRFDAWSRVLKASALGWPWGMGWGGRWEGGSGWGTHVHLWQICANVWQKPLQYFKVISLQLKKKKESRKKSVQRVKYKIFDVDIRQWVWVLSASLVSCYASSPSLSKYIGKALDFFMFVQYANLFPASWLLYEFFPLPWRRKWQLLPVLFPVKSHGWRSLGGYSPWGNKRVRHD